VDDHIRPRAARRTARDPSSLEGLDVAERVRLDVTDQASVDAAIDDAGAIDTLISNAWVVLAAAVEASPLDEIEPLYAQQHLLHALETQPDRSLTMSGLAKALDITQRRVTALVDAMEDEGLVARSPHLTDGRSTVVTKTKRGSSQQQRSWEQRQIDIGRVFNDLSATHQAQLLEIIPLLNDALRRRVTDGR
jgi:DNA-binding MarR family transcriptional regulator